jgi:Lon protease-like protein
MTADALRGDRRIAIAVIEPGFEGESLGTPPIRPWVGVGLVRSSDELPDGRYLITLRGEARGRIERELPPAGLPYRRALVQLRPGDQPTNALLPIADELRQWMGRFEVPTSGSTLAESERTMSPVEALAFVHALAYASPLPVAAKLNLFAIDDPVVRASTLRDELGRLTERAEAMARHRPAGDDFRAN